jgi:hypothetical protein
MSDEFNHLTFTFFFAAADMYGTKKNRMKRWRQQRLQNRAIQIGKSCFEMHNN